MESDEAFARRLQAQELGIASLASISDDTPLMNYASNVAEGRVPFDTTNATTTLTRPTELQTARATVLAIIAVNFPQILASIIILSLHWSDPMIVCDVAHETKWRIWALFSSIRMTVYSFVVLAMYIFQGLLNDRPRLSVQVNNFRNMVDALGLIWFVVGNMWLFGDDDNSCKHPSQSPVYSLCISMIIINYIQICLPCILAAIMIPIFCFCMPCLIRAMARINGRAVQGATTAAIDTIPLVTLDADVHSTIPSDDTSCPICLNEMVTGEEVRLLPCKHTFHRECVDEWLRVNASCPTCRKSILRDAPSTDASSTVSNPLNIESRPPSSASQTRPWF